MSKRWSAKVECKKWSAKGTFGRVHSERQPETDLNTLVCQRPRADLIEGGQRPVTAAPPFWVLAVWDLVGMTGRVYVRKVRRCNR